MIKKIKPINCFSVRISYYEKLKFYEEKESNKTMKNTLKITTAFFTLEDCLTIFLLHLFFTDKTPIRRFNKYIDNYIKDINIDRFVDNILREMIEIVVEENKFDFCLPFD